MATLEVVCLRKCRGSSLVGKVAQKQYAQGRHGRFALDEPTPFDESLWSGPDHADWITRVEGRGWTSGRCKNSRLLFGVGTHRYRVTISEEARTIYIVVETYRGAMIFVSRQACAVLASDSPPASGIGRFQIRK